MRGAVDKYLSQNPNISEELLNIAQNHNTSEKGLIFLIKNEDMEYTNFTTTTTCSVFRGKIN